VLLKEGVNFLLSALTLVPIALLQEADEFFGMTFNLIQFVAGQLAPTHLRFTLQLMPLAFHGIDIHASSCRVR
jgi:hypothetical protein